jgi:AAA domain
MANKEYIQTTLRNFLKFIQKSFDAKRPGAKKTPHIKLITKIQTALLQAINNNIKSKRIVFNLSQANIDLIEKTIKSYMVKMDKTSKVKSIKLSGLKKKKIEGCCLFSGFGIVNSQELAAMTFENLEFTGKFRQLIGKPTSPFHIMFYGLPGSGKSSLAILLSKYLAEYFKKRILYIAREEGIGGTIQEKFLRLNAIDENIHLSEKLPDNLKDFDVLVLDTVNELGMNPNQIREIQAKYPKLSTIQLFKATKTGTFLGQNDFAHLCQAEIRCFENTARAQKNRFGGDQEITILDKVA